VSRLSTPSCPSGLVVSQIVSALLVSGPLCIKQRKAPGKREGESEMDEEVARDKEEKRR
jgi:hypothetical protein